MFLHKFQEHIYVFNVAFRKVDGFEHIIRRRLNMEKRHRTTSFQDDGWPRFSCLFFINIVAVVVIVVVVCENLKHKNKTPTKVRKTPGQFP